MKLASPLPAVVLVALQALLAAGTRDHIFGLGDITYFSTPQPIAKAQVNVPVAADKDFIPLTVINASIPQVTGAYLEETIASYLAEDDVFTSAFLNSTLCLYSSLENFSLSPDALDYLESIDVHHLLVDRPLGAENSSVVVKAAPLTHIPPGPYIARSGKGLAIFKVSRIYTDTQRAFLNGVYPADNPNTFQELGYYGPEFAFPMIP